ncbi:hypothetical protein DEO45_06530 [Rhodanobacter denitrificans]|uniref:Uncharacterized protein n=1 Tax=Rhodanobacter denitrificans TaxID=666685 RepID=A0A368KH29_9GAMM|nr:hypothetical protein [Rhodanobacter denitrificans]RCS30478.1 hypothetical protein DEO45_06530 [Rhodanobacter denitrificans]
MPNLLTVTLYTKENPQYLDINQSNDANHVSQNPNSQTITWQLTGDAASNSSFNTQSDSKPGFAWVGTTTPPAGIFGTPTLSANGNQMTMTDLNNSASTQGTWYYQLSATIGGVVYQSNWTPLTATTTNPTIKNT